MDLKDPDKDYKCPVDGSRIAQNPGLRFKISSKCYHKICESCVDRLFSSGKHPCPIQKCGNQLWKRDWKYQTFEDISIEREVDIRRRVMGILDRAESDFTSKRAWDDFLEQREEMIMNLVFKTDVAATDRKLKEYQIANGLLIKDGNAQDVNAPFRTSTKAVHGAKTKAESDNTDPSGLIHGLKKIIAPPAPTVYDPFQGMPTMKHYYTLREDYSSRWDREKERVDVVAGGFDFQCFYDESLLRAFAGLGCFIEDEMNTRDRDFGVNMNAEVSEDVF